MVVSRDCLSLPDSKNNFRLPLWAFSSVTSVRVVLLDILGFLAGNGALPRMMWEFVPPNPKLLTLTYFLPLGHGRWTLGTDRFHSFQGILVLGVLKSWLGRMKPLSSIKAALMTAATPDAASRWPMFDLTDPIKSASLLVLPPPNAR